MSPSYGAAVMARPQTIVQLSDELIRLLDEEAARRGISHSAVIREAVEAHLADGIGREIVDGYRRIPPATPDEWRAIDRFAEASTRELLERLDAEEPGADSW